jgi:predicted nucleotidyltransferase
MQQQSLIEPSSELNRLRETLGIELPNIDGARMDAKQFRSRFEAAVFGLTSADTSVVVFGSLARDEFTERSDVDWTLLIDGFADPKHLDLAREVKGILKSMEANEPGQEGVFGNLAFSHDIIHQIGGEDDTNSNTTKRILLILESCPIGRRDSFNRVLNHVLSRYIEEDSRFLRRDAALQVPRFLLNDFARYWRTMAVDFAHKRRARAGAGMSIRNIKLRMSRKLIFVSGLLGCFSVHLLLGEAEKSALLAADDPSQEFVRHLRRVFAQTPLEILAAVINRHDHLRPIGKKLFAAYDQFLGALRDPSKRAHLNSLTPGTADKDSLFEELRAGSHEFRDALLELFFDEKTGLARLTRAYGVF